MFIAKDASTKVLLDEIAELTDQLVFALDRLERLQYTRMLSGKLRELELRLAEDQTNFEEE